MINLGVDWKNGKKFWAYDLLPINIMVVCVYNWNISKLQQRIVKISFFWGLAKVNISILAQIYKTCWISQRNALLNHRVKECVII